MIAYPVIVNRKFVVCVQATDRCNASQIIYDDVYHGITSAVAYDMTSSDDVASFISKVAEFNAVSITLDELRARSNNYHDLWKNAGDAYGKMKDLREEINDCEVALKKLQKEYESVSSYYAKSLQTAKIFAADYMNAEDSDGDVE